MSTAAAAIVAVPTTDGLTVIRARMPMVTAARTASARRNVRPLAADRTSDAASAVVSVTVAMSRVGVRRSTVMPVTASTTTAASAAMIHDGIPQRHQIRTQCADRRDDVDRQDHVPSA